MDKNAFYLLKIKSNSFGSNSKVSFQKEKEKTGILNQCKSVFKAFGYLPLRLNKDNGGRKECPAVVRRKKVHNLFHRLASIDWTKAHKQFKHHTQQGMRAGADKVLNVNPL